jgi:hypothetical protein
VNLSNISKPIADALFPLLKDEILKIDPQANLVDARFYTDVLVIQSVVEYFKDPTLSNQSELDALVKDVAELIASVFISNITDIAKSFFVYN